MKLGNWVTALGCLGLGVGAVLAGQGCTATASICTGSTCQFDGGYVPPPNEDSGSGNGSDTGAPSEDASPGTDSASTAIDPCNACLYGQCVGQYSNCVSDTSCLTIYQCATSPACAQDGGNCVQDCYNAGTAVAKKLYLALGDCDQAAECMTVTPSAACAATCNASAATCTVYDAGPSEDSAVPDDAGAGADAAAPQSCNDCQAASCSMQLAACATGTACANYQQCLLGCATAACDTACATSNQAGASAASALGACTSMSCPQCSQ
jgi:hypothetical protein